MIIMVKCSQNRQTAFAVDCLCDVVSNLYPGSDKRVRVLYSNIRGLHANLSELAVAGSNYDVLVRAEFKVSDLCHLSELCIPGFGCPNRGCRTPLLVHLVWLFM